MAVEVSEVIKMDEGARDTQIEDRVRRAADAVAHAPLHLQPVLAAEVLRFLLGADDGIVQKRGSNQQRANSATRGRHAAPGVPTSGHADHPEFGETLGETLARIGPRTHPEIVTAIAAHRYRVDGTESLNTEALRQSYREVRQPAPQNFSDTVAKAIRRGWLVQAGEAVDRSWRVTASGLSVVNGWLQEDTE
jgi:hypothetical protein